MRPSASVPLLWKQIVKAHRQAKKESCWRSGKNTHQEHTEVHEFGQVASGPLVVDPHYTTEAKQADLWLQLLPYMSAAHRTDGGTDGAFGLALGSRLVCAEYQ